MLDTVLGALAEPTRRRVVELLGQGPQRAGGGLIHLHAEGRPMLIRAIDVMTFDDAGKIIDMKAYHGPGDVEISDLE